MFKYTSLRNSIVLRTSGKLFFSDVKAELIPRVPHLRAELYQRLVLMQPNSPANSKVLKISVLGCPNSGKSSLVNMLTQWDICAVSGKVNTTRTKQTVVLTKDNVQLCFIDMPGVIGKEKGFNFKLEKSLIRDPNVGIFESDLIVCVVDVSHKSSQTELSLELLKALHYFKDKPSILVLNKMDKVKHQMKLFDITRRLTEGVVGGRISHKDSYANRYRSQVPTFTELLSDPKFDKLFNRHLEKKSLQLNTSKLLSDETTTKSDEKSERVDYNKENLIESFHDHIRPNEKSDDIDNINSEEEIISNFQNEEIDDEEYDENEENKVKDEDDIEKKILRLLYDDDSEITKRERRSEIEMDDPIIDVLKKQLMLTSVTREDVLERRNKWREISMKLDETKDSTWRHFDDVFAVSSVTGAGIDRLREYLIGRAKPGGWYFHNSLITDQDPETLVQMVVRSQCLEQLEKEVPYHIKIHIHNYEKSAEGSLHIHVLVKCKTSRQLMTVLGTRGSNISVIADKSRLLLQKCFQTDVYLKLTATRIGIPAEHLKRMRSVDDVSKLYPKMSN